MVTILSIAITHVKILHVNHCERKINRIGRHDSQVRLLEADLIRAANHPVVEPRTFGRHEERNDIRAFGSRCFDMFDLTFCYPRSPARVRDSAENALHPLKKAWDENIRRFGRALHEIYIYTMYILYIYYMTVTSSPLP